MNSFNIDTVFLHITQACNLSCIYCYSSAGKASPNEFSTTELKEIWLQLLYLQPRKIVLTGGEPLLRKDILNMLYSTCDMDENNNIIRCLNSNGKLITNKLAKELVELVDEIRISVDAFSPLNDMIRGDGSFNDAMRALYICANTGLKHKVLITVTRKSIADLENLLIYLITQGFTKIKINRVRRIGRSLSHPDWCVSEKEIKSVLTKVWTRFNPISSILKENNRKENFYHCGAGRFINIMPNGDVFPCHVLTQPEFLLGNLRKQNLFSIYNSQSLLKSLVELDVHKLVKIDNRLSALAVHGSCFGEIYEQTKDSDAWKQLLFGNSNL